MALAEFTGTTIALLEQLAADMAAGKFVTRAIVDQLLLSNQGSTKATPLFQDVTLAAGVATIQRLSQVSFVALATEGGSPTDELTTISTAGFSRGDSVIIYLGQTGRTITTAAGGNVQAQGFTWQDANSLICLQYTGTDFVEAYRFPASSAINTRVKSSVLVFLDMAGVQSINCPTSWVSARYLDPTTETLATAEFTVTGSAGTAGTYRAVVDNGSGVDVTIGETVYTSATSNHAQATAMDTAIDALTATTHYTATVLGAVVTIEAPAGTGAAANSFLLGAEVTGGAAATTSAFSDGVDASEAAVTVYNLYPEVSGNEILLTNGMSSAVITLATGGNIASSLAGAIAAQTSVRAIYDSDTSKWIPA